VSFVQAPKNFADVFGDIEVYRGRISWKNYGRGICFEPKASDTKPYPRRESGS
jgi:hypothetical protein